MKKILIGLFLILICVSGFYFYLTEQKKISVTKNNTSIEGDVDSSNKTSAGKAGGSSVSENNTIEERAVAKDFLLQVPYQNITLENAIVEYPYALQSWYGEHVAAIAILKHSPTQGWLLLGGEGGVIDEDIIKRFGVPPLIAKKIMERYSSQ